jgi:hypothetical protein
VERELLREEPAEGRAEDVHLRRFHRVEKGVEP